VAEKNTDDHGDTAPPAGGRSAFGRLDIIFAALALISVLPALLVRYPESVDYLNHLARLSVLTAPADDPIHAVYRIHWHLIPNLGLELIAMPLALLLPLEAVMKIIWATCILAMAAAIWFFHRSLYPRTQATLLLGAIALINLPLTVGLLSFTLGLVLAVAAVGLWLRLGDRATPASILTLNVIAAAILVVHIAACASLALTLGALYVLRRPYGAAGMAKRAAAIASGFVLPALLLIVMALSSSEPAGANAGTVKYVFFWKLQLLTAPVFTGNNLADIIATLALWLALFIAPRFGARCHHRFIAPLLLWLAVLLALPFGIGSATIIDLRQAIFPTLLLIGAISFAPERRAWSVAIVTSAIAGVVLRTALLIPEWRQHDSDVASFRALDGVVERGAKVIVATAPSAPGVCRDPHRWAPFEEHIPVLLVIDRAAFVSTLFAAPGLQPIEPMPSVSDIAVPDLGVVPWTVLAAGTSPSGQAETASVMPENAWRIYVRDWRKNYDYLALRRLNCPAEILPQHDLVPVAESATYRLYRIVHPAE
jgi:hypothetical protein